MERSATTRRVLAATIVVALAAVVVSSASAKELRTTVCGRDGCRVAATPLSGVSTTGRAPAPRSGRFFTLRLEFGRETDRYALVYERRNHLVRAGDRAARAFLGSGWHVLDVSLRVHYAAAVRGRVPRPTP